MRPFIRGERVRLYFRLDQDAYVTIFRVDTDGRVRVLFPREPWEGQLRARGRDFEVDGNELAREAFTIDDYPGVGYLFAVASADGVRVRTASRAAITGIIASSRTPRARRSLCRDTDLAQRIVPRLHRLGLRRHLLQCRQHYDYPRFLCYDCHT